MQVFGGLGYEQGTAVEAMFRDSRVFRFGGGTDEIQRHIIQRDEYKRLSAARGNANWASAAPGRLGHHPRARAFREELRAWLDQHLTDEFKSDCGRPDRRGG